MNMTKQRVPLLKMAVGLTDGQRHRDGHVVPGTRGSGWYNERGEWIGWGDLDSLEMRGIANRLTVGELFIVLHVEDSYFRFLRNIVPDSSRITRNEDAPGIDYIAEHVLFIIEKGQIHRVHNVHPHRPGEEKNGVLYQVISQQTAKEKIFGRQQQVTVH